MNKTTLTTLFSEYLFQIPNYQRGYAWEDRQWNDFIQDIDALVDEDVVSHYTGTVVIFSAKKPDIKHYGTKRLKLVDVVDGQQRLTSSCLYLSAILLTLVARGAKEYESEIANFLYSGSTCKLNLNNDCHELFYDLLKGGRLNTEPQSIHAKRLLNARQHFQKHLDEQLRIRATQGNEYLKSLFNAIVQKLGFTYYAIEDECEIGMTFELMNSRGKDLSIMELLKNYFMHWIYRNVNDDNERSQLTSLINKNWKITYTNIGKCNGDEDQCLRIAWILFCNHTPSNWNGYAGFKEDSYFPLRNFSRRNKEQVKDSIILFSEGLAEISGLYATVLKPLLASTVSPDEIMWLQKIHNTGNIANFLPLMVVSRKYFLERKVTNEDYIELLKALESYAYRVFLFEGKRSNAGKTNFSRWAYEVFSKAKLLPEIKDRIYTLILRYAAEEDFKAWLSQPNRWYDFRRLLKYTLYEYELHLLRKEGKNKAPALAWDQLNDSTIEHILPQNPGQKSHWKKVWKSTKIKSALHDIGNLVLTQNNSNYRNFEFVRKKGEVGVSPSYCNSDIRQERKVAIYQSWTNKEFLKRRGELIEWVEERWGTHGKGLKAVDDINEDSDEDEAE